MAARCSRDMGGRGEVVRPTVLTGMESVIPTHAGGNEQRARMSTPSLGEARDGPKTSRRPGLLVARAGCSRSSRRVAEGPYRNRDSKDPKDLSEGTYPIPYQKPTVAEITEVLERVHGYLEANSPTRVVDGRTGDEITDFSVPNLDARIPDGAGEAFYPLDYTMGVTHSGMLLAQRGHRGRALRGVHAAAAAVHRRPPPVLPRGGREGRPAREGDLRGDPPRRAPSTTRARCARPSSRRAGPGVGPDLKAGHRPLERLRRAPAVPARGRHPRPAAPAARVAVGRRPLHERARRSRRWARSPATGPGSTTR